MWRRDYPASVGFMSMGLNLERSGVDAATDQQATIAGVAAQSTDNIFEGDTKGAAERRTAKGGEQSIVVEGAREAVTAVLHAGPLDEQ